MFSRITIRRFELWGNCKDGFDCNNSFKVDEFDTDVDGTAEVIERAVKRECDSFQSLPLTERGGRIHYHSSRCLRLDWSDDCYADVVCTSKDVAVGEVWIETIESEAA